MTDFLGGSAVIRFFRRSAEKIKATAAHSLFWGRRLPGNAMETSGLAEAMNRRHPAEAAVRGLSRSGIIGWLYDYWGNLCAAPLSGSLGLLAPLLGILAVRMAVGGRWAVAGGLLMALGLCVILFTRRGTLGGWIRGSLLGRLLPLPAGAAKGSVLIYLGLCGLLGGCVGWYAGVTYGCLAAIVPALLPLAFRLPPIGAVCLLLALLPVCGTGICWVLSCYVAVSYFLARAFGGHPGRRIDGLDLLLLVFPVLCVISTLFSFHRADSLKVIAMWLGLFLCVPFLRRIITDRKKLYAALVSLTAGAAVSGGYGLFQYLSGMTDTTWTDTALFEDSIQLRVYSTFANPNVYGEFLLLTIPLIAGLALHLKGWKRWLLLAVDGVLMVNMILTYSRGCYVGIALTAVVFLWNFSKKWMAGIAAVGIPLAILLMPESVTSRILSIGNLSDTSTNYRLMIYVGTLLMFTRYWFSGVGIGERAFNAIYPYFALTSVTTVHSHSLFFQSVVSFGIVGLIYLVALWVLYQTRMKRCQLKLPRQDRMLMIGFGAVMWGMLVQSIFDYTWYNYRVFQLFWIVIVLGFAAVEVLQERRVQNG
ncbi:MAG: O-antigen ligase family protein [Clostridia bacterium]|nr:O-antigen ligase family protein [Clostridia bacterium]